MKKYILCKSTINALTANIRDGMYSKARVYKDNSISVNFKNGNGNAYSIELEEVNGYELDYELIKKACLEINELYKDICSEKEVYSDMYFNFTNSNFSYTKIDNNDDVEEIIGEIDKAYSILKELKLLNTTVSNMYVKHSKSYSQTNVKTVLASIKTALK